MQAQVQGQSCVKDVCFDYMFRDCHEAQCPDDHHLTADHLVPLDEDLHDKLMWSRESHCKDYLLHGTCTRAGCETEREHFLRKHHFNPTQQERLLKYLEQEPSQSEALILPCSLRTVSTPPITPPVANKRTPSSRTERPGEVVGGTYKLLQRIGTGSHATVWQALHLPSDKVLAMKQTRFYGKHNEIFKRTFREIKLLQHFQKQSFVVNLYDVLPSSAKMNDSHLKGGFTDKLEKSVPARAEKLEAEGVYCNLLERMEKSGGSVESMDYYSESLPNNNKKKNTPNNTNPYSPKKLPLLSDPPPAPPLEPKSEKSESDLELSFDATTSSPLTQNDKRINWHDHQGTHPEHKKWMDMSSQSLSQSQPQGSPQDLPTFPRSVFLVLELCDMDLQKLLELRSLSWETIKDFSCQLVRAIALLHEANVIHRDLKPQNILIRNIENKYTLKLCDFGTGRGETYSQIPQNLRRTTLCDVTTLFYCPPEGILDQHFSSLFGMASPRPASPPEVVSDYSNSVDCWALGCIVGEMVKRSPLFQGDGSGCDQLRLISGICGKPTPEETLHFPDTPAKKYLLGTPLGDAPSIDELFPCPGTAPVEEFENFKDFLKKLLVFDPKKRMTAREALEHPFISPTHSHYPPLPSVSPFCALNKMEQGGVSTDKWKGFLLTELDLYQKNRPALTISH